MLRSASKVESIIACGVKLCKDYEIDFQVHKKKVSFPLLMRKYKTLASPKPAFMFENHSDISEFFELIQKNSDDLVKPLERQRDDTIMFEPEGSTTKGFLIIGFTKFITLKAPINVSGSKVTIENYEVMSELINSCVFAISNQNFEENYNEEKYNAIVSAWIENDEEFGLEFDSLDDEFESDMFFNDEKYSARKSNRDIMNASNRKAYQSTHEITTAESNVATEIYKNELENKEKEISLLRREFDEYKKMNDFNMQKRFEDQSKLLRKKNEIFEEVDSKMTNISEIVSLFNEAVTNVHCQIHEMQNMHGQDIKFYEKSVNDRKLMDDSFLALANEELNLDTLDNNANYQEVRTQIIDLMKNRQDWNAKKIEDLGVDLATIFNVVSKEIKFYENERLRYYFYPLYGNDDVYYTGFIINNRCEGYGRLYLKGGENNIFGVKSQDMIIYEGDFRKGGIHNKSAKIYHNNGNLRYEGGMLRGKRHSDVDNDVQSKMYFETNQELEYIGGFANDEYNGEDVTIYFKGLEDTVFYQGSMLNGLKQGYGIEFSENKKIKYEGYWSFNNKNGPNFSEYDQDGNLMFYGTYENGIRNGHGIEYYQTGKIRYDGLFKNNQYDGKNIKVYDKSGNLDFVGECQDGEYVNGFGKMYYDSGILMYEGEFVNNQPDGDLCKILEEDFETSKNMIYEGVMRQGKKVKGYGRLFWPNGS